VIIIDQRNEIHYRFHMHTLHQKSIAILLSLLLGLLPLQGIFANETPVNIQGGAEMAGMDHEDAFQMAQTCDQCDQCNQGDCCNDGSCSASCTLSAVLAGSSMNLPVLVKTNLSRFASLSPSSTLSFLYRPPRA